MSPTCSNRFLAGRKARSAALRITRPSPLRMSAQLWASRRDLYAPPAHQHADEAEARSRVVVLAPQLAEVVVRDAPPFVGGGVRDDRLQLGSVGLLHVLALAEGTADLLDALRKVVSQRLEVTDVEHTRTARRADFPVELVARAGRGEERRQLALELRDLVPERATSCALVDLDLERGLSRQPPANCGPGAIEPRAVPVELERPVRPHAEGVQLECELLGIRVVGEVTGLAGIGDGRLERHEPFAHEPGDLVAHRPGPAVELDRSGDQETATAENLALHVVEPCVREGQDLLDAAIDIGGPDHLVDEHAASRSNGFELEVELRAEVREEA